MRYGRNQRIALLVVGACLGSTLALALLVLALRRGADVLVAWVDFVKVYGPAALLAILAPSAYAKRGGQPPPPPPPGGLP